MQIYLKVRSRRKKPSSVLSSQYPGHSLTGPVRVRNFFQSLLGGLLDRLEDTMERLAMERKYETRMILPLSGVFGGPGTRSSLGGQGQIGKSLVGPAGAGTGVGRQAQGRVMCAIHVAGQLGLKNLSHKTFCVSENPLRPSPSGLKHYHQEGLRRTHWGGG